MPLKKHNSTFQQPIEVSTGQLFSVSENAGIQLQYQHPNGKLFLGDSLDWLQQLDDESIDLVVADPPYNLRKAEWDTFDSQAAYINWSLRWIKEVARTLKASGSLYVCGFSEVLADLKQPALEHFHSCRWLIWHYRNKANLGQDWGRSHESILHFRKSTQFRLRLNEIRIPYGNHTLKYPAHPQAITSNFGNGKARVDWTPNPLGAKPKDVFEIPTTCNGMGEKTPHPTQKPEELVRRLVLAASDVGQIILDPFSGAGTTLVVAEQLGRNWLGCEQSLEYNHWAIQRLETVPQRSTTEWIELDRKNAERRERIR